MAFKKGQLKKRLGALPSKWQNTHFRLSTATLRNAAQLPTTYNELMSYIPAPHPDQGNIGSCVGWCGSMVMEVTNQLEDSIFTDLSAGWLYSRSRAYANIPLNVEGSTNLGLMKALYKEGATTEDCAPTDIVSPFTVSPCGGAYEIDSEHYAGNFAIDSYWNVAPTPLDIKSAIYGLTHIANYLMPDGSPGKAPLVAAFPVYESFYDGIDNGIIPMPQVGEKLLGGHSSPIFGWDVIDDSEYLLNPGSWGNDVGDNGVFKIPIEYPFYTGDFWLIHNGPPTHGPKPTPSGCPIGNGLAKIGNVPLWVLGRRGRFHYMNP